MIELQVKGDNFQLQDNSKNKTENVNIKIGNNSQNDLELYSRSATSPIQRQLAVYLRSACKRYGSKTDPVVVLDELNMTVPKGVIYGLLGASGCGKTTLLNCIVGRKRLDSGEICVLGGTPGSKGSGIPGPRVGYMPQGTALYGDFTIRETLFFFGWIAGMTSKKIEQRLDFFVKLLTLPNVNQRVQTLSGGQQRRVSLATALLHEPELLILDEPSVGLDSVLRDNIWNHFFDITRERRTTIVITTHYIDEARNAHLIALMRRGYFLIEDSPERLLLQNDLETLEELFFKLSNIQETQTGSNQKVIGHVEFPDSHQNEISSIAICTNSNEKTMNTKISSFSKENLNINSYFSYQQRHMKALFWKNFLWMIRNFHITLITLFAPFMTLSIFCLCIGNNPSGVTIAVVNHETSNVMICEDTITCNNSHLSCYYLKYLEEHNIITIPYDSEERAIKSVLKGETAASIFVKSNYSEALQGRVRDWQDATQWEIQSSEIDIFRDVSSKIVSNYIKVVLYDTFQNFLHDYMASCNIERKWLTSRMSVSSVYGVRNSTYRDFLTPGILSTFICLISAGLTIVIVNIENDEGLLERILVSGVSRRELITIHVICQFVLMVPTTTTPLIATFAVFNTTMNGSFLLLEVLSVMIGFCGMCYGLCISCASERIAFHAVAGSIYPIILLSGIIWPVEGMNYMLKPLALALPTTHTTESMRSIMYRGLDISAESVYMGFICTNAWSVGFLIMTSLIFKFKKE